MDEIDRLIEDVRKAGRTLEFYGPQNEESITALQESLSLTLPPSFVSFLRRFGGGGERTDSPIAGIYGNQPLLEGAGSAYGETLMAREDYRLPQNFIVIYHDAEVRALWCLDTSKQSLDHECPVVSIDVDSCRIDRQIAPTFGAFFELYLRTRTHRRGEIPRDVV